LGWFWPPRWQHFRPEGGWQRIAELERKIGQQQLELDFARSSQILSELHREIARLRAAQDVIHMRGGATKVVYQVGSEGEQATVSGRGR
jgi:hypothetical protein